MDQGKVGDKIFVVGRGGWGGRECWQQLLQQQQRGYQTIIMHSTIHVINMHDRYYNIITTSAISFLYKGTNTIIRNSHLKTKKYIPSLY